MAGAINLIVTKEAQKQLKDLMGDLEQIEAKILAISQSGLGKRQGFVDVTTQKKLQETLKENEKLTKQLGIANDKLVKTNAAVAQVTQKEATAYDQLNKSQKENIAIYNDLITKKAQGIQLSKKEVLQLKIVERQIKKNKTAYSQINAAQQNMGLTAKRTGVAFDSLGFSIAQLTRESPAFINSVQTGFMALSNNIPIFVDEVDKLIKKNQQLAADGQKTIPVWKQVGKAFFSVQTLISVAILAITVLGPKIFEMAKAWWEAQEALDATKFAQDQVNKAMKEGTEQAQKELTQLKVLSTAVQDLSKTEEERNDILNQIRKEYGKDIEHLTDREILTNGLAAAEDNLKQSILDRARADAASSQISENMVKILELEKQQREKIQEVIERQNLSDALTAQEGAVQLSNMQGAAMSRAQVAANDLAKSQGELIDINKELGALYVSNNKLLDVAVTGTKGLSQENRKSTKKPFYLEGIDPETVDGLRLAIQYNNALIGQSKDRGQIKKLQEENAEFQKQLDLLLGITDVDKDRNRPKGKEDKVIDIDFSEMDRAIAREEEMREALLGQSLSFAGDAIASLFDFRIQKIDEEMEKLKERYDLQRELIEAEVTDEEAKKQRLAELDKEQRLKEKELEKRRKEEEKKAFLISQAIAVGQVVMDAALGVAEATSMAPATFGASLAWIPLIKAAAAIQIGTILAQTIPAFKDGHLSGTHEGTALINDGGNIEVLQRKDGRLELSNRKNKLVHMNKGDLVHKDIESFLATISPQAILGDVSSSALSKMASGAHIVIQSPSETFDEHFKQRMIETMTKGLKGVKIVNNNEAIADAVREAMQDSRKTFL